MINLINKTPEKITIELSEEDLGTIIAVLGFLTAINIVALKKISPYYINLKIHKYQDGYRRMYDKLFDIYGLDCRTF